MDNIQAKYKKFGTSKVLILPKYILNEKKIYEENPLNQIFEMKKM